MREVKARGDLKIKVGKGSAFAYETDPSLPAAHQACLIVGARGSGKSTAAVSIIEKMPYDRVLILSPTMKSNRDLMQRLKVDPKDVFEDPDDPTVVDQLKELINEERDVLEKYWKDMARYKQFVKTMETRNPIFQDDDLLQFWNGHDFRPPTHRWNGKKCCIAILFDDCQGSNLYSKPRKINQMVCLHRHLGSFEKGGALGASLFFLCQSYKASSGGITRTIRGNITTLLLFANKNQKMLDEIAEECSGEISTQTFMQLYSSAVQERHDFLFIDFFPKKNHPSGFRRNFQTFLVP
jgi:hypothetical protein